MSAVTAAKSNNATSSSAAVESDVHGTLDRVSKLIANGEVDEARKDVEAAIAKYGRRADLLSKLADVDYESERYEDAIAHLKQAVQLAPEDAERASEYVNLLCARNLYRRALTFITELPSEVAGASSIRIELGRIYRLAGWHALAIDAYGSTSGFPRRAKLARWRSWCRTGGPIAPIRRQFRRLDNSAKERWNYWAANLKQFDKLDEPKGYPAEAMRASIDNYLEEWAYLSICTDAIRTAAERLSPLLLIGAQLFIVIDINRSHVRADIAPLPIAVLSNLLIVVLAWRTIVRTAGTGSFRSQLIRGGAVSAVMVGGSLLILDEIHRAQPFTQIIAYSLIAGAAVAALTAAIIWAIDLIYTVKLNRLRQRATRETIIDYLLDILEELASPSDLNDIDTRQNIVRLLEFAAERLERDLPKPFKTEDRGTDEWLATRAEGAATAIRQLKRYVVVSNESTWDHLTVTLRDEASALATGNWANLRWVSPPAKETKPKTALRVIVMTTRTVIVMFLPLAATLTLGSVFDLTSKTLTIAKAASAGWSILYFLLTIDPTLQGKIEAARNIVGTVRETKLESAVSGRDRER